MWFSFQTQSRNTKIFAIELNNSFTRQPWRRHSHIVRQPWPRHSHVVSPKYGHSMATVRHDRSIACALMQCTVRLHALTLESQRMTDVFGWDGKEHTLPQMRQPAPCLQAAVRHRWLRGGQRYRRTTLVDVALWAVMPLPNAQANLTPTDDTSVDMQIDRHTHSTQYLNLKRGEHSLPFLATNRISQPMHHWP